tara:strand:- start:174 stop:440 length:267 start_codon:yes stop_codon:yes gene_type:complete
MASPRKASAINPFLILDGLLRYLLDQQGFCMSDSSYAEREAEGINESGFHQHGLWTELFGVLPPGLLHHHSPSGETRCTALVYLVSIW